MTLPAKPLYTIHILYIPVNNDTYNVAVKISGSLIIIRVITYLL